MNVTEFFFMSGERSKPSEPVPTFRGKGSFGCVVSPAISCVAGGFTGNRARLEASPHVSKVFFNASKTSAEREAMKELDQARVLRAIDPDGLFTVQQDGYCHPDLQEDVIKGVCNLAEESHLADYQLLYRDGGMNLSDAIIILPFMDVFKSLVSILSGLVKMNSGPVTYIHGDLTEYNMTLDVEGGSKFSKMIDFGMLQTTRGLYEHSSILTYAYEYWPPEYDIIKAEAYSNGQKTLQNVLEYHEDRFPPGLKDWYVKSLAAYNSKVRKYFFQYDKRDLVSQANFIRDTFSGKFDLYGLGVSLLVLFADSDVDSLPPYVFDFIKGCADPNPYTRMTAQEALDAFLGMFPGKMLPDLSEYLTLTGRVFSIEHEAGDPSLPSPAKRMKPPTSPAKSTDSPAFRQKAADRMGLGGARRFRKSRSTKRKTKSTKRRSHSSRKRQKSRRI